MITCCIETLFWHKFWTSTETHFPMKQIFEFKLSHTFKNKRIYCHILKKRVCFHFTFCFIFLKKSQTTMQLSCPLQSKYVFDFITALSFITVVVLFEEMCFHFLRCQSQRGFTSRFHTQLQQSSSLSSTICVATTAM